MVKNRMIKLVEKRGQITLFVILALVIISIVFLYIFWIQPTYITPQTIKPGLEGCMEEVVKDAIKQMEKQYSGFPGLNFSYSYKGEQIPYLCYTNLYLQSCINQKPFLLQYFAAELKKMSQEGVMQCYENSLEDLRKKGIDIGEGQKIFNISLNPDQIVVSLKAPTSAARGGAAVQFTEFKSIIDSPVYNMMLIITYLVQQETRYGDSIIEDPMILHPQFLITKIRRDDGNKVYIIKEKNTGDIFKFATRSVAWPVGYGYGDTLMREQ